jgi:hypothetical protein
LPKLTKHQRDELKSLVANATVRRLTAKETSAFVYEQLGVSITDDYIRRLRMDLKRDCAKEMLLLQNDVGYYLQRMFFDRVDELQYQQRVLHEVIDKNKDSSPDIVIRAVSVSHGITVSLSRLFSVLPVSTIYIPSSYINNNGNGNTNADTNQKQLERQIGKEPIFDVEMRRTGQKQKELAWRDEPIFWGKPGSNFDENGNRIANRESDMPEPGGSMVTSLDESHLLTIKI